MMLYAITLLGCTTYSSPVLSEIWCISPFPDSASSPLPVTVVLPQCAMLIFKFHLGFRLNVCPVHASKAFLRATIQSSLPSRCTTTREVIGDFVPISAV